MAGVSSRGEAAMTVSERDAVILSLVKKTPGARIGEFLSQSLGEHIFGTSHYYNRLYSCYLRLEKAGKIRRGEGRQRNCKWYPV